MSRYEHKDGLYRKVESPVVESVRHTEGLYKKTKVAKVEVTNPTELDEKTVKAMEESNKTAAKKVLKG